MMRRCCFLILAVLTLGACGAPEPTRDERPEVRDRAQRSHQDLERQERKRGDD